MSVFQITKEREGEKEKEKKKGRGKVERTISPLEQDSGSAGIYT